MLVDVFSLTAVSYDRFVSIAFPFRPRMGPVTAYGLCAIIWVLAASIGAPLITARTYKVRGPVSRALGTHRRSPY